MNRTTYYRISVFAVIALLAPALLLGSPQSKEIDKLLFASLDAKGIEHAERSSDEVFLRRIHIDLTGQLPDPRMVENFLQNKKRTKRVWAINNLIQSEAFADYWTMKWCDLLRVKAEFPINMWPNGVQAYGKWIHDSIADNMPYDEFARLLLTSSGSNFRVPPVNFYRGVQGEKPSDLAAVAALTFMGTRLEKWPKKKQADLTAFFSRIQHKGTAEWKEIIVTLDPASDTELKAIFPDGTKVTIKPDEDPRVVFADWLISADNEWFARNIANRAWSWFFGSGLINEPDDIRNDNPAVHPEVLAYLEKEFIRSNYDIRHLFRIILNSEVYQQSSALHDTQKGTVELFARYPVRRLDAEVLLDALSKISGNNESYMSMIPEPFTFIPSRHKTVELIDGSITSKFLKMFGRPPRDTGLESERSNEPTDDQRLHMLNSSHVQNKIQQGWRLRSMTKKKPVKRKKKQPDKSLETIYLAALSRFPTEEERDKAEAYIKEHGKNSATADVFWALINSKEFLYRH
jgi:hypothetical protein